MQKLEVFGANRLKGHIKISGSKNASLPILAATLLSKNKITLKNLPKVKDIDTMTLTTFVITAAAIISIPFMIYAELFYPSSFNSTSFLTILYLGLFPTAIAFQLRFHIISKAGPIFLSYVAYLIPAFAIIWGYLFLNETATFNSIIGVVLVLFGRGKISGLMGEVGKGITSFKKGISEGKAELEKAEEEAVSEVKDVTPEKDKS